MTYLLYTRPKWFSFLYNWQFLAMTENLEDIKKRAEQARKDGFFTIIYGKTKDHDLQFYYRKNKPHFLVVEEET